MERLRLSTYRQVWTLERVIYKIEGVRLPFAVTFRQVGLFLATASIMVLSSRIPLVGGLTPTVRYLLVPATVSWYLTKRSLDGKPPHHWLRSLVRFWLGPRKLVRYRPAAFTGRRTRLVVTIFMRHPKTTDGIQAKSNRGNVHADANHLP